MRYKAGLAAVTAGLTLAVAAGSALAFAALAKPVADAAPRSVQLDPQSVAVAAADRAAASGLDALRKGAGEEFDRRTVYKGGIPGQRELYYVSYDRTYEGMRIVGGDAVVVSDGQGKVVHTVSATSGGISLSTRTNLTAAQATAIARKQLSKVDSSAAPELVVLAVNQPKPVLAWDVVVSGVSKGEPSRQHVYVNALNGKVAFKQEEIKAGTGTGVWSGSNLSLPTSGSSGNYKMEDPTRGNISCRDYSNGSTGAIRTDADDVWGSTSKTDKVSGCVDVFYTNTKQWDMLKDWFGRNGFNGQGGAWPSYVGLADKNAYWDYVPNATLFGYNSANQWLTGIDVVAHENGHGLDENTPGGTAGEAGLGEATGDIWGALTEHFINSSVDVPDYKVGELVNFSGNGNPLRYMYQPSLDGRSPNCWSTSIPNTEVHDAAGPMNHWFYLLAEGNSPGNGKPDSTSCSGGPTGLVGVGIQDAGKVFYNAMLLKTSGMTHGKYRVATLQAAKNLDSTCGLYNKTKAAWNAVALPAQSGEATCTATGNEWSMSLNPTAGSVQPGSSLTVTVNTTTTSGSAQNVALSATGAPSGVTVSFSPTSVSTGNSSTMTIATTSSAAAGSYTITVNGDGTTDHSVTYALTIGDTNPPPGIPDIDVQKVQAHLAQFGTIASNNGGNRRAGSAGYTASVTYIKDKLTAAGYTVTLQNCTSCVYPSNNLIADWPGGPADQVTMFGAHLDSVSAGPGINDNASGSAALLENALALAAANPTMSKHIRFGWWTDEEQGINGSEFYVGSLSATAKSAIKGYYNLDMIASPNGGYFINNLNTTTSKPMKDYWDSLSLSPEENTEGVGRSDDASFKDAGIPTSGYAAGASAKKTTAQQQKWGGTANAAYDSCYHQSCDTTNNINATALNRSADGVAYTIWKTSVGDTPPPADDFSISLNPTSGSVNAGSSATATVNTATTAGSAQTVNLSATGQGSGVTVSFNPTSVTSGNSSTMTISVAAGTPSGNHSILVKGQGSASHTTTYTLTVNGSTSPSPSPSPSTTTSPPPSGRTFTNGTDYQIVDNRIFSSVTSTATGSAVSPVKLSITINHTCSEDLGISLIAPNGAVYAVKYSGSGNYQCSPFGGTRLYNVPVSATAAGTWQLRVTDYGPGDYGVLDTWSITL